jgi:drug/metabolite transporter (DMT)-like permease
MAYGLLGTILYNVSKGMQRQGIEAVSGIFISRRRARREGRPRPSPKITALYTAGFILNNSLGFFAILANRHAPASYFTSMFGLGIVALMLYSGLILKEPTRPLQYAGAAVLAAGTLLLGADGILREQLSMSGISLPVFGVVTGFTILAVSVLMSWAHRSRSLVLIGAITGVATGFAASLDPILKGVGQSLGGGGRYLPRLPLGWVFFLLSFVFATLSFVASQWIFSRGVRASVLIPSQNFSYIVYPILVQGLALPGFNATALTVSGLAVAFLGFVLMQIWTPRKSVGGARRPGGRTPR